MEFSLNLSCSKRSKLKNSTLVGTIKLRTRGRLENGKRKREERCISFRVSSQRESLEIKQRLDLLPWCKLVHSDPSFMYERRETRHFCLYIDVSKKNSECRCYALDFIIYSSLEIIYTFITSSTILSSKALNEDWISKNFFDFWNTIASWKRWSSPSVCPF